MRQLILSIMLGMCCSLAAHAQFSDVKLGDIIDFNGNKAIVFQVDEAGQHGIAMSLKCLRGVKDMWCSDKNLAKEMPSTASTRDGEANTKAVVKFAEERGALSSFPLFEWCSKLGEGWYVPSIKELEAFVNYWVGNEQTLDWDAEVADEEENKLDESRPFYRQVNQKITHAGGVPFINGCLTSTVNDDDKVYGFWFNREKNTWKFWKCSKSKVPRYFCGRAFHKF